MLNQNKSKTKFLYVPYEHLVASGNKGELFHGRVFSSYALATISLLRGSQEALEETGNQPSQSLARQGSKVLLHERESHRTLKASLTLFWNQQVCQILMLHSCNCLTVYTHILSNHPCLTPLFPHGKLFLTPPMLIINKFSCVNFYKRVLSYHLWRCWFPIGVLPMICYLIISEVGIFKKVL